MNSFFHKTKGEMKMKKMITTILFAFAMIFQLSANENWFAEKFPEKLLDKSGKEIDAAAALKGKMVAVSRTRVDKLLPELLP